MVDQRISFRPQSGALNILIVVPLLILITGGLFIYEYWWIPKHQIIVIPEEVSEEKKTEEKSSAVEEKLEEKEKLQTQELIIRTQEAIIEVQKLASKIQEFIEEKEKERMAEIEKALEEAKRKSNNIKGVYMTEFIANSQSPAVIEIREDIKRLLDETEIDAIVIDVKEAYGPNLPYSLKKLIDEFHQKDIWVIARIVAFRDSSLIEEKPEWHLGTLNTTSTATSSDEFWKDWGGGYWLDPASPEVQNYIIEFSQRTIDFGFDELQFDYVRFPTDGDLENIIYPFYDKEKPKYEVIQEFFLGLSQELKSYKPSIILSVDLFGYVATQFNAFDIGQRLIDAADLFDYISFMLYPSHFYGGFEVGEDSKRELPSLYFPYVAEDVNQVVSSHPYEVVYRSILLASDYLSLLDSQTKIRPWLQAFNLKFDIERGIYYDTEKIRAQIEAAEDSGASGWLLWNSANIYPAEALKINP